MSKDTVASETNLSELISVSDDVVSLFCQLGSDLEDNLIEYMTQILQDILCYTEAVRMGKLGELLNTHPTIKVLGDFLMGRSQGHFSAGFEKFEFILRAEEAPAIRIVAVLLRKENLS